jgi:hypothetical protein
VQIGRSPGVIAGRPARPRLCRGRMGALPGTYTGGASILRLVSPIPPSTRVRTWLIAVSLSVIQAVGGGVAAALAQEPIPVKREILGLYDGAQEGDANFTRIHRFAEITLNYLGFILRFHDIRTKLPEPAEIERYRGVFTWFAGSVSN